MTSESYFRVNPKDPYETKPNPRYRNAASMKLYAMKRVERIERQKAFQDELTKTAKRRESARRAAATKRQKLDDDIDGLKIKIPVYEQEPLIRLACAAYNASERSQGGASEHSDPEFLKRIAVNFLRHECSDYDDVLSKMAGKTGSPDARLELKEKILDEIGFAYEWLADEVSRQIDRASKYARSENFFRKAKS